MSLLLLLVSCAVIPQRCWQGLNQWPPTICLRAICWRVGLLSPFERSHLQFYSCLPASLTAQHCYRLRTPPPPRTCFYKVTSELCSGINTASVITPYGYRIVATGWGELNVTWLISGITAKRALMKPQDAPHTVVQ